MRSECGEGKQKGVTGRGAVWCSADCTSVLAVLRGVPDRRRDELRQIQIGHNAADSSDFSRENLGESSKRGPGHDSPQHFRKPSALARYCCSSGPKGPSRELRDRLAALIGSTPRPSLHSCFNFRHARLRCRSPFRSRPKPPGRLRPTESAICK
ncbi:hypothetical protein GQ53DRAFT_382924 [Thozetella sp. PMI_491]|nr:hypothetical protein GQ53DRAFT_382924 [Thozetella sp. PMI_491]